MSGEEKGEACVSRRCPTRECGHGELKRWPIKRAHAPARHAREEAPQERDAPLRHERNVREHCAGAGVTHTGSKCARREAHIGRFKSDGTHDALGMRLPPVLRHD